MKVKLCFFAFLFIFMAAFSGSGNLYAQTVGPLIQTKWDQAPPFTQLLDRGPYCGPIAWAQIMAYHRHPVRGRGEGRGSRVNRPVSYNVSCRCRSVENCNIVP